MPTSEAMKRSTKRTAGKLLHLPDALEANIRAGDLWSLHRALNGQPRAAWPARSAAVVRLPSLRLVTLHE
jgi:hypothetical protein